MPARSVAMCNRRLLRSPRVPAPIQQCSPTPRPRRPAARHARRAAARGPAAHTPLRGSRHWPRTRRQQPPARWQQMPRAQRLRWRRCVRSSQGARATLQRSPLRPRAPAAAQAPRRPHHCACFRAPAARGARPSSQRPVGSPAAAAAAQAGRRREAGAAQCSRCGGRRHGGGAWRCRRPCRGAQRAAGQASRPQVRPWRAACSAAGRCSAGVGGRRRRRRAAPRCDGGRR